MYHSDALINTIAFKPNSDPFDRQANGGTGGEFVCSRSLLACNRKEGLKEDSQNSGLADRIQPLPTSPVLDALLSQHHAAS